VGGAPDFSDIIAFNDTTLEYLNNGTKMPTLEAAFAFTGIEDLVIDAGFKFPFAAKGDNK
jgi:uncharacterized protein YbbC (DUF1343 family)